MAASTRSPARPSGTVHRALLVAGASRCRHDGVRAGRRRGVERLPSTDAPRTACTMITPAATLMHMSATLKTGQCGSCEEVHDVAAQRPGRAEHPVGEVAEHAGQQQPEADRPARCCAAGGASHSTTTTARDRRRSVSSSGVRRPGAERGTRVAGEVQGQQVADAPATGGRPVSSRDRQHLGDQVERRSRPTATTAKTGRDPARRADAVGPVGVVRVAGVQRRSSRCLHVRHSVARGNAINRFLPIGSPQISQTP